MSSPHFYQADEQYVRAVVGMRPNRERHQTTIDINPVRGLYINYSPEVIVMKGNVSFVQL